MRLMVVIATHQVSGPGRQLAALAKTLRARGVEVLVAVLQRPGAAPPPFADYLEAEAIPHVLLSDRRPLDWALVRRVRQVLDAWRPDVVQTHGYKSTAVVYAVRHLQLMPPWVGFFHGSTAKDVKDRVYHLLDRRMLRAADRVVVMSLQQRRLFRLPDSRVRVIYNAVLPVAKPEHRVEPPFAVRARRDGGHPLIGVVGRLSREKGVDVLLEAFGILARQSIPYTGLVVGDGPQRLSLEAMCRRLGIDANVRFVGHQSCVEEIYRHLDLLVIPSRSEGLPNVLLEALQADVPVVSTAVGAVTEVAAVAPAAVRLVPPGSATALAASIDAALAEPESAGRAAARSACLERFSLDRRVEDHVRLYGELTPHGSLA